MAKYNVVLFLESETKGHGYYRDDTFEIWLWEKDGTLIINQTYADDSTARAAIVSEASALGWLSEVATTEYSEPPVVVTLVIPSATLAFKGVASAAQNIHGAAGTVSAVGWDSSVNDVDRITDHDDGESTIQFSVPGDFRIHASVAVINAGLNNRQTYALRMRWLDSLDVEKDTFYLDDTYIRDDATDYDSGIMAGYVPLIVEDGDKIIFEVEVLDEQTPTGTVNADVVKSKIRIDHAEYSF